MGEETAIGGNRRVFPQTRWTLIRRVRADPAGHREEVGELLGDYWKPLYHLARRKGLGIEAAKDAVQGFLARLLERDFLAALDPARGRFRSYLRAAFQNYLANLHAHDAAQKRGGDVPIVALDFDVAEREIDAGSSDPEAAFDRAWALAILERALSKLREEYEGGERSGAFAVVLRYFHPHGSRESYAETAAEFSMSIPQIKSFLHRARARFRCLVREEVASTLANTADADEEIAELMRALGG
jgi:RNA polymerase sigma factor (sigma-70 family)